MKLLGKVAVVTGGGSGIGKGIAQSLANYGVKVYIASRSDGTGEAAANEIRQRGGNAVWVQTDVSRNESVKNLMNLIEQADGRLDHVCNNAGVELFKTIEDTTEEDFDYVMNTDLKGVFLVSKYALPLLRKSSNASIINISSVHAFSTIPELPIYAAAKGGVNAMSRSMAIDLGRDRIRVISVCPGFIDTPIYQRFIHDSPDPKKLDDASKALHPIGRLGTPHDIAEMVAFLASDDATFITGSTFYLDGGLTAKLY